MKKSFNNYHYILVFFALLPSIVSCYADETRSLYGKTMGNDYTVTWSESVISADRMFNLKNKIDTKLKQINDSMSTWKNDSELSLINQSAKKNTTNIKISPELAFVINQAISINKKTNGALDITAGPLVNLWGFGPNKKQTQPTQEQINNKLQFVGINKIQLNKNTLTVNKGVYIDLSSIAKGYGVDKVADILEGAGINNYLIDIGGELRVKGLKNKKIAWKVGIDNPYAYSSDQIKIITPGDSGIATSGDYRHYFENKGMHFSHIINPKTGAPIRNDIASVTVITDSCMKSDGFATAFMVLPIKQSLSIANHNHIPIMIIKNNLGKLEKHYSNEFNKYIKQ